MNNLSDYQHKSVVSHKKLYSNQNIISIVAVQNKHVTVEAILET